MARTPNYDFERRERERLKAEKKAAKAEAKAQAKAAAKAERERAAGGADPAGLPDSADSGSSPDSD